METGASSSGRPSGEGYIRKKKEKHVPLRTKLDESKILYAIKGRRHDEELAAGCSAVPEDAKNPRLAQHQQMCH